MAKCELTPIYEVRVLEAVLCHLTLSIQSCKVVCAWFCALGVRLLLIGRKSPFCAWFSLLETFIVCAVAESLLYK